jgi:VIT1/CCC1 family predicted Fe2+/Mn2+ transporter
MTRKRATVKRQRRPGRPLGPAGADDHDEVHRVGREGWLRAAVLGADDGIVSTASLMIGVAATSAADRSVLVAGVAGLVAGAMSMAAGEFLSVSSQRDAEEANIAVERRELAGNPEEELRELATIYEKRGLDPRLAREVAEQLTRHDELEAHLRDELGLNEVSRARPLQAALVSAASFASAAALPIVVLLLSPAALRIPALAVAALAGLGLLGALGGYLGGAPKLRAALRVLLGGGLGMAISAMVGRLLGMAGP